MNRSTRLHEVHLDGSDFLLCDRCIADDGRRAGRQSAGRAVALVLSAAMAAALAGYLQDPLRTASGRTGSSDGETFREALGGALQDYALGAFSAIAALVIAIAVSVGQNARQVDVLEREGGKGERINLRVLRQLTTMDVLLSAERVIALVCMTVVFLIASAAFAEGGAGPLLLGTISILSAVWLAFQLGQVDLIAHRSTNLRLVLNAAYRRAVANRVGRLLSDRRGSLLVWWAIYLFPVVVLAAWPGFEVSVAMRVYVVAFTALVAAIAQEGISTTASSALKEEHGVRVTSIVVGAIAGIVCGFVLAIEVPLEMWGDHFDNSVPAMLAVFSLSIWYLAAAVLLSCGVAGVGWLRAASSRYIGLKPNLHLKNEVAQAIRSDGGQSGSNRVGAWVGIFALGVGAPAAIAGIARGGEGALAAGVLTFCLLAGVLRVAGYTLFSNGWPRQVGIVVAGTLLCLGAALVALLLRSHWPAAVGACLCFLGAAAYAGADVVWQVHGGRIAHRFVIAQRRREAPVRDVIEDRDPVESRPLCAVSGCRNSSTPCDDLAADGGWPRMRRYL